MRSISKTPNDDGQLEALLSLARLLAKGGGPSISPSDNYDTSLLADISHVMKQLVAQETRLLSNRVTLLELAAGSPKGAKPVGKARAKAVKL
ncbi:MULTISPECIES: hypothetical protein [unclassified Mesorhizobium]|uniref:hypothetical protein n=1 Tax=unclassified Mesorhizobium TaxID=325217 RepID=UPI0003CEE30F|nr:MULTISPECIES: hypothetical protein [unclassified Mesorhizobium]ESY03244.1 hypothetical protein X753_24095 [Mesorhizobium sp. LNJC399B00]WJI69379.1 hypothetical protein NLY36_00810 [Mesorhizobium sp. C399B]